MCGLSELTGDAAVLFDPLSPSSIAEACVELHRNEALRNRLADRGWRRLPLFTWRAAADRYRALYRHLAGRPLSVREGDLLREMREA